MKRIDPFDALNKMCHVSERLGSHIEYTISDERYPEYNGKKIKATLLQGKVEYQWKTK